MAWEIEEDWAYEEFGQAELGDARRTARLVELGRLLGAQPQVSIPQACEDTAQLKAAYRFFATDAIQPAAILESHVRATATRCRQSSLVLAVQDTTQLDWTHHPSTSGLGPVGRMINQQGMLAHSTLTFTPQGVPLGLVAQQVWKREALAEAELTEKGPRYKAAPVVADEKVPSPESNKWLTSLAAVNTLRKACPTTTFVSVGDREADLYDLFIAEREEGVELLVRASHDRRVAGEAKKLWAGLEGSPVATTHLVKLPRKKGQPGREALLTIRYAKVELLPPANRKSSEAREPVTIWAVLAREEEPPAGAEAVEWLLLTTCPVTTAEQAIEKLEWYRVRWGIEVWHKILKSGCKIEERQLETGSRLERCLTVYSIIAWRILSATMLARELPEGSCSLLLEQVEWEALYCHHHKTSTPPVTPPTLREVVLWIGQLGGFIGRKSDGEPGVTVLWRGFARLLDIVAMYQIMRPRPSGSSFFS